MNNFNYLSKTLLLLCFLAYSITNQAQNTISGTVLSSDNNPIEFANIALIDTIHQQLVAGTISDKNGAFQLRSPNENTCQLSIQFIGYEDWFATVPANKSIDFKAIVLSETSNELSEVVVTSHRPVIERKEDKLVFNIASSTLKSGYDGMEVLQQAPNVWIDSNDNILMRNEAATILINGRQLNMSSEDLATYIRNLPSDHIKSIEIQSNPSSNADAENSGGIINIVLRKKAIGFNTILRTYYETFGESFYENYAGFTLNYGAEKWNIYSSYNFFQVDNIAATVTDISYLESGNYLKTNLADARQDKAHRYQLGFVLSPWKNHEFGTEFFGNTRASLLDFRSNLSLTNIRDTIDYGVTNSTYDNHRNVNNGVLNYTWTWDTLGSQFKIVADYAQQNNLDDNDAYSIYALGEFEDNQERYNFDNQTNITAFQADVNKNFKNGWKTTFGAKYTNTERENNLLAEELIDNVWIKNDQTTSLNYQEQITAIYTNISKKFAEKHFIKAGVRTENTDLNRINILKIDTISKNYTDWFPSVFYSYDLSAHSDVSLSYSKRLSRPAFRELNNDVFKINDFRYSIGNPDLRPEYIDRYHLSYHYKKQNASIYYHQYNDAINGIYFLVDSIAYYQRQNNGAQKQVGIEYNTSGKLQDWWSVRGSIHFFHRKYTTDEGEDLFKKSTVSIRLFNTFHINETTSVDLSGRYMSPYADAFYEQDAYYYINLILKKSFFNKKLNFRIYVDDIFNTFRTRNTRPFDDIITTRYRKPRSRSVRFWLTYNFATKTKTNNRKNKSENESRSRM